jgi:alpha-tubulin suppressor-like RCC1 family protein
VAGGNYFSAVLTSEGKVYTMGASDRGTLGTGQLVASSAVPTAVKDDGALLGRTVTAIAAGSEHMVALTSDGKVYTWGWNHYGALGDGTNVSRPEPVEVGGLLAGKTVTAIAAAYQTTLVLTSDGKVYGWGYNALGNLGDETAVDRTTPVEATVTSALEGRTIVRIAAGETATVVQTSDGLLCSWGNDGNGERGDGSGISGNFTISTVDTSGVLAGKTVTAVSGRGNHFLVRTSDGKAYGWGYNGYGSVGDGTTVDRFVPVAVDTSGALAGKSVSAVSAGPSFSLALTSEGDVFAWGLNNNSQLGNGSQDFVPHAVPQAAVMGGELLGKKVTSIEAASNHALALTGGLSYTQVVAKGDAVPGAGVDPRIPAGAVFTALYAPAVNDAGQVAYLAKWKGGTTVGAGIFVDGALQVALGDALPGGGGETFKLLKDPVLSALGNVAFLATVTGAGVTTANDLVAMCVVGGTARVVAREGGEITANGPRWRAFTGLSIAPDQNLSAGGEEVLLSASLIPGSGNPAVTKADDTGVWRAELGTAVPSLMEFVREGKELGFSGLRVKSFVMHKALAGSPGHGRSSVTGGDPNYLVTLEDGSSLLSIFPNAMTGESIGSSQLDGAVWAKFNLPSVSRRLSNGGTHGSVLGTLAVGPGGIESGMNVGIFATDAYSNGWEPVAFSGEQVPGLPTMEQFKVFKDPVNSGTDGGVAFVATLREGMTTSSNDLSLWHRPHNGDLKLLAREGNAAPAAGVETGWKSFDSLAYPGGGSGPVFQAKLLQDGATVTGANDLGLYGVTSEGTLVELLREGGPLLGKTVKTFATLKAVPGSPGVGRFHNHAGEVVALVGFAGGAQAIVKVKLP